MKKLIGLGRAVACAMAVFCCLTALCTPWAEVNRDLQDEYRDKFSGEKEPFGLLTTDFPATYAPPRQWVRTWNPNATGTKLIFR